MGEFYPSQGSGVATLGLFGYRKSQRYHTAQITTTATGASVRDPNTIFAFPFPVELDESFDAIVVEVTTAAVAGSLCRLGIYNNGSGRDPVPGSLLLDAGTISIDSNAVRSIAISVTLHRGLYWLAFVSNTSATYRRVGDSIGTILGFPTTIGSGSVISTSYSDAFAFAALPDPFPGTATISGFLPFVFIKKA